MKNIPLCVGAAIAVAILACVGCSGKPNVTLSLGKSKVFIAVPAFELTGGSPKGGTYEGRGVANNRFSPEDAGVGVHEIVYTYKNVSASGSIEVFGARQRRADPSCTICNGSGFVNCELRVWCDGCANGRVILGPCMTCNRTGRVRTAWKLWLGEKDCSECGGAGMKYAQCKKCKGLASVKCPDCKGTGKAVCKCAR